MDVIFENLIPLIMVFMLLRGILSVIFGKKKQRQPLPEDWPEQEEQQPQEQPMPLPRQEPQPAQQKPDLAAEFERRLKKTTEANAEAKKAQPELKERQKIRREGDKVVKDTQSRIHRDGEKLQHDKPRVHTVNEAFSHDKGRVYYDPRGDYSYNEARMNAEAAAFSARLAKQEQPQQRRVKLKHAALVNGFLMAQVLDKPRAMKPYGEELL